MSGLYLPGDKLSHQFHDGLLTQAKALARGSVPMPRPMGVQVVAEVTPGMYQCRTPLGIAIQIEEGQLWPMAGVPISGPGPGEPPDPSNDAVLTDFAAITAASP